MTQIAKWNFDEGEGNIAHDSSGENNNGTIFGANWAESGGLAFDGIDDYVEVFTSSSLNSITDEITLIAIVESNITARQLILERYYCDPGINGRAYQFDIDPDGRINFGLSGDGSLSSSNWLKSEAPISPNTRTHIAAVSDGATMKIYINGMQDPNTLTAPIGIHVPNINLHIGRLYYLANDWRVPFNGTIRKVKIYNQGLSREEIEVDYKASITGTIIGTVINKEGIPLSAVEIAADGYSTITD